MSQPVSGKAPVAIDLYCGLGGWTEALLAEGWRVIGFDIERHDYGNGRYPAELILQDVRTIHGAQLAPFRPSLLVASSPCQFFSRMAMPFKCPWKKEEFERRRNLGIELFWQSFRIQHELSEALGEHVPLIAENVVGAQKWIGEARWHFGSYYLWGDVPALMPSASGIKNGSLGGGSWFGISETNTVLGQNPDGRKIAHGGKQLDGRDGQKGKMRNDPRDMRRNEVGDYVLNHNGMALPKKPQRDGLKGPGGDWFKDGRQGQDACAEGIKQHGSGAEWLDKGLTKHGSRTSARKAASAMIAKIPAPLAQHIARVFKP